MLKKGIELNKSLIIYNKYFQYSVILLLVFIIYGNTLKNKYSLDDTYVVYKNQLVKQGLSSIPDIFSSFYSSGKSNYEYRPIVKLTFAIEYQFFGEKPAISHLINILLYFLICILFLTIFKNAFKEYSILLVLAAVLLFTAHPIHTEVVASLKNRDELLSMLFALLTLKALINYIQNNYKTLNLILIPVFFAISLLSKSSSLVYCFIIPLTLYMFYGVNFKKTIFILIYFVIIFILIKSFPRLFLPYPSRMVAFYENPLYLEPNILKRIPLGFIGLFTYIKLLIYPHPLVCYYGYNMFPDAGWGNIIFILSIIFHLGIFIYSIMIFKKNPILSYAILFYISSISMFSNIIRPVPGIIGERLVFGASFGFCLAMAVLIFKIIKINQKTKGISNKLIIKLFLILLIIIIPYSKVTISRNRDWYNYMSLLKNDIKYLGNSAKANNLFGLIAIEEISKESFNQASLNQVEKALSCFIKAAEICPGYSLAWNNIGSIYFNYLNNQEKALFYFKKAIDNDSTFYEATFNIAHAYEKLGDIKNAKIYFYKTLLIRQSYLPAYAHLSTIYFQCNDTINGIKINKLLIEVQPNIDLPYINLANHYIKQKDTISAISYAEKAIEKQPKNKVVNTWLFNYYKSKNDNNKMNYYKKLRDES